MAKGSGVKILVHWLAALLWAGWLTAPVNAAPALWLIRDADTEITLFGTVHALPAGEAWLAPRIGDRLDAADTLVIETILPDDPLALEPTVAALGLVPGAKPLAKRLPASTAAQLPAAAAAAGVPIAALDRMATWLAAITISEAMLEKLGVTAGNGVEPALLARARALKKPLVGLETPEQQLHYLANLPEPDQLALLVATLGDVAGARTDMAAMLDAWRSGDVDRLARDFAVEAQASPLLMKVLITDRNRRWADWIVGVLKRPGKLFIAVGAGHFGCDNGLLAMLRARGLTVEPLP